jgi:hypothetical protein
MIICFQCLKSPEDLEEYSPEMTGSTLSATEYVQQEEGTYNPANGHFCCTPCYIRIAMPDALGRGWKAP